MAAPHAPPPQTAAATGIGLQRVELNEVAVSDRSDDLTGAIVIVMDLSRTRNMPTRLDCRSFVM
jgi:hypothetical protein